MRVDVRGIEQWASVHNKRVHGRANFQEILQQQLITQWRHGFHDQQTLDRKVADKVDLNLNLD